MRHMRPEQGDKVTLIPRYGVHNIGEIVWGLYVHKTEAEHTGQIVRRDLVRTKGIVIEKSSPRLRQDGAYTACRQ
jgi:hypothetical protein